jgi:hypothetical protein
MPQFTTDQLRGVEATIGKICETTILLPQVAIEALLEEFEKSQRTLPLVEFKRDVSDQMKALRVSILMVRAFLEFNRALTDGMNAIMAVERPGPKGVIT